MENKKKDKRLINEIEKAKNWMKFLDDKNNYNKSFHTGEEHNNLKSIREYEETEYDDSPDKPTDDLLLGSKDEPQTTEDDLISNEFFLIAMNTNGDIHIDSTDEAENKDEAMDILDDNMYTDIIILDGVEIDELMDKLYELRGVAFENENENDKPPFINTSDEDIIDEDAGLEELQEAEKLIQKVITKKYVK